MITNGESNPCPLPLEDSNLNDDNNNNNNNNNQRPFSILPFFGVINMTITSVTTIYRAYNNGDFQMIAFVTFVFIGTFLLDSWIRLYNMPPHDDHHHHHHHHHHHRSSAEKLKLKIGIWVLVSSIMFGFAYEFSTFLSFFESLAFFGVVTSGNIFLFYVYFIWELVDQSGTTCSITSGGESQKALASWHNGGKGDGKEYRLLLEGVDNV
ncbi:hypothetical protein Fmac_017612 [Flemingia macrophylla]|uniref:Uncharacterized protein n=1 Tax=Flemingia macrophylla TaxID=520843 RepID=A0ABD1M2T0_9FABA